MATMQEIMRHSKPDVVFHLASTIPSEHKPQDIASLIECNLRFGTQLVEAMSLENIRHLVNTGTSWQNFENRDYSPVNLYAATKQAFEVLLQYYVEMRGLQVVTLKLFDTYGPDDPRNKVINLLLNAVRTRTALPLTPGRQFIDLVHIDDVVRAYGRAADLLSSGHIQGHQRFNVSSGQPLTLRALVNELEQTLHISIPIVWDGRRYRQREVMTPLQSEPRLPGWEPRISLHQGLRTLR